MRSSLLMLLATVSCLVVTGQCLSSEYPTINPASLKRLFTAAKPYTDVSNAFFSAKGLTLLGEPLAATSATELCALAKSKVDKASLESIYYATSLASLVGTCQLPVADFQAALTAGASSQNVADIFYYVFSSVNLKTPIDVAKVTKSLTDGLKADSSILNQAYSLHIATQLTGSEKTFFANIDDLIDQADEIDGKFLQYDGGVGTTSFVLEGVLLLSEKLKQLPAKFDQARVVKFVNYLTSKRQATNIKSAFFLTKASLKLTDNQFTVPLVLNRVSPISVLPTQANLIVSLTNIMGGPVKGGQFVVEAESAKSQKKTPGPALFAAKRAFASKSSDGTQWEVKLIDANQVAAADFYTVAINVSPKVADKKFVLVQKQVEVKVTTVVELVDIQVGVADRDQSSPKLVKLEGNNKLKDRLEADAQSKFYLKFGIKEKTKGSLIEAHQAFVRFTAANSARDIVFLAQASASNQYTADVDLLTNAKNFKHTSGVYSVELIVSDSLIENPIALKIGDIRIQFSEESSASAQTTANEKASLYSKKPEIKHIFRQPDPTPSKTVSSLFAILCLLPLGLLFVLWFKIGFNFSKFQVSLSAIIFHVSFAGIFVLFYLYWVKFDMFQTLKYLAVVGGVTFVSGNQLLKGLAAAKEKKN